jgi:hypothetical protein
VGTQWEGAGTWFRPRFCNIAILFNVCCCSADGGGIGHRQRQQIDKMPVVGNWIMGVGDMCEGRRIHIRASESSTSSNGRVLW